MNTKLLMSLSALTMGFLGIICTFLPNELLLITGLDWVKYLSLFIQILGASYLGFALLNWSSRSNLFDGSYSKSIAMANFAHYTVGGLALLKYVLVHHDLIMVLLILLLIYGIFAVCFAKIAFTR